MQENEFEKRVRIKMDELQLVPSEDVWKKVSANIHKEKRRKRVLIFLLAIALLAGGSAFYFYNNTNKNIPALARQNNSRTSGSTSNKTKTDLIQQKAIGDSPNVFSRSIKIGSGKLTRGIQRNEHAGRVLKLVHTDTKNIETQDLRLAINKSNNRASSKRPATYETQQATEQTIKPVEQASTQPQDVTPNVRVAKSDSAKGIAINHPVAEIKKDTSQPAFGKNKSTQKVKIPSNKKWNVGFTLFSGVSNNLSGITISSGGAASYSNYVPPSASNGNSNSNTGIDKLNYKSGFSYGLGLYLKKHIHKTVSFSAGANYHFLSATSLAGSRNTTTQTFYDASFQSSAIVSTYYSPGQTVEYRNKYHLVEFPLNVFIQLNKNQNKLISITAGISPAYLISSQALYANMNQNVYYENGDQFRKLLLAGQAGIQLSIFNASHFNITAGPEVQYGFNNMAKPATATNQHLFSAGLKLNVTLK